MAFDFFCCRFCLTTDENGEFKKVSAGADGVADKVSEIYGVNVDEALICKRCEEDIETAWALNCRIKDAEEYLSGKLQPTTEKLTYECRVIFECDICSESFNDIKSLDSHITDHNEAFACFFCKETFATAEVRHDHLETTHGAATERLEQLKIKEALKTSNDPVDIIVIEDDDE